MNTFTTNTSGALQVAHYTINDRVRQAESSSQPGGYGSGIGATGAMRADSPHKRRTQKPLLIAVVQNIHGFFETGKMAAFHESRAAESMV